MDRTGSKRSLETKDLITTGIFSTLFLVVTMVSGMFFAPNPVLTFLMPAAVAFFTGPVYMLLLAKVPKRGPTIILGIIMGIVMFVTGMFWLWSIAYVLLGLLAGEIAATGGFKKYKLNMLSFGVFSLNPMAAYMMIWLDWQSFQAYLTSKGTEQAYLDAMFRAAQDWMLPAMIGGTFVAALLGAILGTRLLKKHFIRAGVA